jgi:hypothetical protein
MTSPTNFLATYLGVVIGTFLLVMTVAFLSVPYAMKAHPGESMGKSLVASSYHLT